jgi:hypothetical protein
LIVPANARIWLQLAVLGVEEAKAQRGRQPELKRISTEEGILELSIFETGVTPHFRLSGVAADT